MQIYPGETQLGGSQPATTSNAPAGSDVAGVPGTSVTPSTGVSETLGATPTSSLPPATPTSVQAPIPIINAAGFARLATLPFPMAAAANAGLALPAPSTKRTLLAIRNSKSSVGSLYIAFDQSASDLTSPFSVDPGGVLFFDITTPQNDVYLAGSAYPTNAVIGYANLPL